MGFLCRRAPKLSSPLYRRLGEPGLATGMSLVFRPAPSALPRGLRVYAIGDVHGCAAAHAAILGMIAEDYDARPALEPLVVHLGDLIDRGPDNAAVLARVAAGSPIPGRLINLLGNHEALCLEAMMEGGDAARHWRRQGGDACLADWGIPKRSRPEDWAAMIPPEQLAVLRQERPCLRLGGYFFTHAGIRPGLSLDQQNNEDLVWIREPFLSSAATHEAVVVHGHTPRSEVTVRSNRIGIDTGAVYGGKLTALVLEDDRLALMQVPGPKKPRK
jgi:serine/threonine protein phosphatase 1